MLRNGPLINIKGHNLYDCQVGSVSYFEERFHDLRVFRSGSHTPAGELLTCAPAPHKHLHLFSKRNKTKLKKKIQPFINCDCHDSLLQNQFNDCAAPLVRL